jgi:uncharacterized protein (TIGR00369 family)
MTTSSFNKKGAAGFGVEIPFVSHLGFELELFEGGESVIAFTPRPEHLNTFGVLHGGACMTLLDVCMALAARSVQKDMGAVTIEMKTSFMRPAPGDGSRLLGKGRLLHRTATMAFMEATLYDALGKACAHATGTFKYVRRLPVSPKSANNFGAAAATGVDASLGIISTD